MKIIGYLMMFLICMCLSSCKQEEPLPQTEQKTQIEKDADLIEPESSEVEIEEDVNVAREAIASELILYEEDDIEIVLKGSYSTENNRKLYILKAINKTNEKITIDLKDWIINDSLIIPENITLFLDPYEEQSDELMRLNEVLFFEEANLLSIDCQLFIEDKLYEVIQEKEIQVTAGSVGIEHKIQYDSCMGAKAKEQVLQEDDKVKITLKGWGKDPGSNYVRGVVLFENKSEKQIPVCISGIAMDNIYFNVSDHVEFLEPGEACYSVGSVWEKEITESGIESITELKLLILTEESQNTGVLNYAGGIWYPVELEETGETPTVFKTGEQLQELEDIKISLIEEEHTEYEAGGGSYKWILAVENEGDHNIELEIIDVLFDGISMEERNATIDDTLLYILDNKIGAHCNKYEILTLSYEDSLQIKEISFKFKVESMGGDEILYVSDDPIIIAPQNNTLDKE